MAMAMLLGLDASTRVAMGLDAIPRMGVKKTPSSASASGYPSKQQDSAASNSEKKERIVVKINLAAWRQRKAQQQQMESSSPTQAINTCSEQKKVQEEEEETKRKSLELKLEASKRKLQLGYQQVQKAKRKIQLVDLRDIPKPEPEINLAKKSKCHYHH